MKSAVKQLSKEQKVNLAWKRGLLAWKLYKHQLPIYRACWQAISNHKSNYVINVARRFGKSSVLCLVAIEFAIRYPGSQIRFAAPTAKQLRKAIRPIMNLWLSDCPDEFKPEFKSFDDAYIFPNGSEIHMAGTDAEHSENLRGQVSHLNILDEAASMDNLDYVMRSILMPQTLTTGGTTLLASTPPPQLDHDYVQIAHEAKERGDFIQFTINDNESLTKEQFERAVQDSGGQETSHWKREYLCMFVNQEDLIIIPEWSQQYVQEVQHDEFFMFYHKYEAMDIGVRDFTAVLFAYYDYRNATLVIEDEITINGPEMTTDKLAKEIKDKEQILYPNSEMRKRVGDNSNLVLLQDLTILHKLPFNPTNKEQLEAMVNETRMWIKNGRVKIHPRCEMLIGCLKFAVWHKHKNALVKKMEFARSSKYKHYDHLAALIYLIRNIDTNTNPIPADYRFNPQTMFAPQPLVNQNSSTQAFKQALLGKRRRR